MSHEIRTPMNAIIGLGSIALKAPDLPERTRDYLEKIGAGAKHLLGLINDILDMSRIKSGRLTIKNEEFSFSDILEQINTMVGSQCQERGLTDKYRVIGRVDDYYIGDNMKLKQVIINILGNAVKRPDAKTVPIIAMTANFSCGSQHDDRTAADVGRCVLRVHHADQRRNVDDFGSGGDSTGLFARHSRRFCVRLRLRSE